MDSCVKLYGMLQKRDHFSIFILVSFFFACYVPFFFVLPLFLCCSPHLVTGVDRDGRVNCLDFLKTDGDFPRSKKPNVIHFPAVFDATAEFSFHF